MDRKLVDEVVTKVQQSTTDTVARIMRDMAPKFRGTDGETAIREAADAIERGGRK